MVKIISLFNLSPISITKLNGANGYETKRTAGGATRCMEGVRTVVSNNVGFEFVGWPGIYVPEETNQRSQITSDFKKVNCVPVFIESESDQLPFLRFYNQCIWPILHNFVDKCVYNLEHWQAYKRVNAQFARVTADIAADGDLILVNCHHLMMVPYYLRDYLKVNAKIVFLSHCNFPGPDVWSAIPNGTELCVSLMKSDLVSFHLKRHANNFIRTCSEIFASNFRQIDSSDFYEWSSPEKQIRTLIINDIPIGITPQNFDDMISDPRTAVFRSDIKRKYADKILIISVERLDYIKAIHLKLRAYDLFLERCSKSDEPRCKEWLKNIIFVQIAVPHKLFVKEISDYSARIRDMCTEINGRYAAYGEKIELINEAVDLYWLQALYLEAEMCVISSQADGMNMVSYEFVYAQQSRENKPGMLILSEFAGSATFLRSQFVVNPFDCECFAQKYRQVLEMDFCKRKSIQDELFKATIEHDAQHFVKKLFETVKFNGAEHK